MFIKFNPFKSMTIQGTVAAIAPYLLDSFNVAALGPKAQVAVTGFGMLWAMFGLRNAVEKAAGRAVAELADKVIAKGSGR